MASFGARLIGAAKLDAATYEEVEHDKGATGQAAAVVILQLVPHPEGLLEPLPPVQRLVLGHTDHTGPLLAPR